MIQTGSWLERAYGKLVIASRRIWYTDDIVSPERNTHSHKRQKKNHKYIHYRVSLQSDLPLKLRVEFRPQFLTFILAKNEKKERTLLLHTHTTWQSRNNKKKLDSPITAGLDDKPEFFY